jgi:transmembrane sensor
MTQEEFIILAGKIAQGTASQSEVAQYNAYYNAYQAMHPEWEGLPAQLKEEMLAETKVAIDGYLLNDNQAKVQRLWPRIAVAAAAVAALVFGLYFFTAPRQPDTSSSRTVGRDLLNDIAPGKNGATITLANGQVIQLSGAKTGVIVGEGLTYNDHTPVSSYTSSRGNERSLDPAESRDLSQGRDDGIAQNLTAETQKGQTYQFTLPDGTKVWLNADSKIEFPSNFMNSKTRNVKLTGEAYFAVVHNAKQPFILESDGQVVEDIGTEFNINAYPDESNVKTTLVEGSAKVSTLSKNEVVLKPNQQSVLANHTINVKEVNTEEAMAWKNGLFRFNDEKITSIMKKLERWYNIEVVYEGEASSEGFTGKISRNNNISEVLMMLEQTKGVKFKVSGRRVTIIR